MRYPSIRMDLTFPLINFYQRLYASYNGVIILLQQNLGLSYMTLIGMYELHGRMHPN